MKKKITILYIALLFLLFFGFLYFQNIETKKNKAIKIESEQAKKEYEKKLNDLSENYFIIANEIRDKKTFKEKKTSEFDQLIKLINSEISSKKNKLEEIEYRGEMIRMGLISHCIIDEDENQKVCEERYKKKASEQKVSISNDFFFEPDKEKVKSFVNQYCSEDIKKNLDVIELWSKQYNLRYEVILAIINADSSCGKNLTTSYNYGNVGNTDSGKRIHFNNFGEGIMAIIYTLNGLGVKGSKLDDPKLNKHNRVCELSIGGWNFCDPPFNKEFYASSKKNWHNNAIWALDKMTGCNDECSHYPIRL